MGCFTEISFTALTLSRGTLYPQPVLGARSILRKVFEFEDLANNVRIQQMTVYWVDRDQLIDNFNLDQGKFMSFNCHDAMPVEIET